MVFLAPLPLPAGCAFGGVRRALAQQPGGTLGFVQARRVVDGTRLTSQLLFSLIDY